MTSFAGFLLLLGVYFEDKYKIETYMKLLRPILVTLVTIITITVNGLANALPINGLTTGEISDSFPVYFVPAGYVFAIWGLIYLGLLVFCIFQFFPQTQKSREMDVVAVLYGFSSIANSLWIIAWHYGYFIWTLVLMLVLLLTLIGIYHYWGIGIRKVDDLTRWMGHIPIQIYLGWISVATVANFTIVFYRAGFEFGIPGQIWSAIMIGVVGILTGFMLIRRQDYVFALVILWSLVGIQVKFIDIPVIVFSAVLVEGMILILSVLRFFQSKKEA
jgi:hypothetical protein